ncbi:hypothetical protein [Fluviicola sp.]|uniref:hypothetical protein n=1 Tax=Fluviicola sp. TaxID=1917219 RepID=UPI003D2A2BD9
MGKLEIRYESIHLEKPISEQKALEEGSYCRIFCVDGQILKKECFYKHVPDSIYWYTPTLDDVIELLSQLRSEYPTGSIILVKREPYLDYIIEIDHCYEGENPVYTGGNSFVYNHLQEEIYSVSFDENDQADDPLFKTFYDGIVYYRFYYSENGELDHLSGWSQFQEDLTRSEIDFFLPGFIENNPYFGDNTMLPTFYSKDSFVLKKKPEPVIIQKMDFKQLPKKQPSFYRRYPNEIWLSIILLIILLILFFG